ncbi:MAG: Diaminopimelate decarboxylase [Syntrophomonadaceae bacterium]|nr:Diaminopimelate decarboxylase [Bacillota bacterium]MBT9146904.1 Diaminopimelate decarboxylase [Bacillota bacterium]
MRVYISGVHSGPNPSPGLGLARSLRAAYPDMHLVAVDYSIRSSGLHDPHFDDIWLQCPWDQLNLELYSKQIQEVLDSGALWLSGLDLEILWLAHVLGEHPNLLIPPASALSMTAKPEIPAHTWLPMKIPAHISVTSPEWDLHSFCRRYGWRVFLKGPNYEAREVDSWETFTSSRSCLSETWSTDNLFLQAHITGHEESIAFAAYRGELLDCVYMSKRSMTGEGKTWAAQIAQLPTNLLAPLQMVVRELSWTGGAEVEFIRDSDNILWLIDWNTRFPAWIHGATIAGHNLPAVLVQAATGDTVTKASLPISPYFTRIVIEIPCNSYFPLPPLHEMWPDPLNVNSKHPSGMPVLGKRLKPLIRQHHQRKPEIPALLVDDIQSLDLAHAKTPQRLYLEGTIKDRFERFSKIASQLTDSQLKVHIAYSIKTDPATRFLRAAFNCGMLAEAISQPEVERVVSSQFSLHQVVLNGPAKWWPSPPHKPDDFKIVFADSIEELASYVDLSLETIGIRLRLPSATSRFGVPLDTFPSFRRLITTISKFPSECPIGLHFHLASNQIGVNRWWQLYDSFLGWAIAIQRTTGKLVESLDVGGGWFPDDADTALLPQFTKLVNKARDHLPNLREFILEPGKALVQSTMVLAIRVVEVRCLSSSKREIVTDGAIADLPMSPLFPHRILTCDEQGLWNPVSRGEDRILGRLCMENDILASNVHLPSAMKPGDLLLVCDAGAYDRSMSYVFGQG